MYFFRKNARFCTVYVLQVLRGIIILIFFFYPFFYFENKYQQLIHTQFKTIIPSMLHNSFETKTKKLKRVLFISWSLYEMVTQK